MSCFRWFPALCVGIHTSIAIGTVHISTQERENEEVNILCVLCALCGLFGLRAN